MIDTIVHIADLAAFRVEALAKADDPLFPEFSVDEKGNLTYNASKVFVHYSGNESIALFLVKSNRLDRVDNMTKLGVCQGRRYLFDSPEKQATYERLRGDLTATDGEGNTYQKPYMIGVRV